MTVIKMAFKPLRKRRKRGARFATGLIKRKIVLIISNQFPEGIKEPDLRDALREEWRISEPKGVKLHLEDLKKKKVLIKEEKRGFPNVWRLNPDYQAFKSLAEEFLKSEDKLEFMRSRYTQSIINENFVDHFAANWGRAYADLLLKATQSRKLWGKTVEELQPSDLRKGFYDNLVSLDKEGLIQILRLSPTSLNNFLFPEEVLPLEWREKSFISLSDCFVFPFVSDVVMYRIPEGKGIEVKLELEYGDAKNVGGRTVIDPSLETKSHFKIFVAPKVRPLSVEVPPKSSFIIRSGREEAKNKEESLADNP